MKVSTHLMFQGQASAALEFYTQVFPGFEVIARQDYGESDLAPPGTVQLATVSFNGATLQVIDSPVPHDFDFTPSLSLFVDFDDTAALETAFVSLSEGGETMMPVDNYGFSRAFGWCKDRFGLSWQLNCA